MVFLFVSGSTFSFCGWLHVQFQMARGPYFFFCSWVPMPWGLTAALGNACACDRTISPVLWWCCSPFLHLLCFLCLLVSSFSFSFSSLCGCVSNFKIFSFCPFLGGCTLGAARWLREFVFFLHPAYLFFYFPPCCAYRIFELCGSYILDVLWSATALRAHGVTRSQPDPSCPFPRTRDQEAPWPKTAPDQRLL